MANRHVHYFELNKGKAYLLYDTLNLTDMEEPIIIGDERDVKNTLVKLPKDTIVSYYKIKDVDMKKDEVSFKFKKILTRYPKP